MAAVLVLVIHVFIPFAGASRSAAGFQISHVAPFSRPERNGIYIKQRIRKKEFFVPATNSLKMFDSTFLCHRHRVVSRTSLRAEVNTKTEFSAPASSLDTQNGRSENLIQELLDMARRLGPVGIRNSVEDQETILNLALSLQQRTLEENASSALNFTDVTLTGVHELIYSAAPGGSSGKIGPLDGKVTQNFVNATTFINAVDLGPLRIALTASRKIKDETTIAVRFHSTTVSLFGVPIVTKSVGGGGIWKILFTGVVDDKNDKEHPNRLLRVLQTPSLVIIEQKI